MFVQAFIQQSTLISHFIDCYPNRLWELTPDMEPSSELNTFAARVIPHGAAVVIIVEYG